MSSCLSQISVNFFKNQFLLIIIMININSVHQLQPKSNLLMFSVKENVPIGETVGQIESPGFSPPYEMHDFQEKKFTISKSNGVIKVSGLIDREKQNLYSFLIISMNGETKNIQIKVLDVNDNEPKFNSTNFEKSIPENYPIGSKVDLTTVFDPDEGKNSIQSVRIVSGDSEKVFAIDYHDGSNGIFYVRLILKHSLDYELISQFNLVIQAIDGGDPPLQATLLVKIIIQNANDNVPKFDISRYIASVKEDQEVNVTFLRVRATDNDAGVSGELFYFLDNTSPSSDLLAVDHKSGNVYLRKSLDFEKSKSHHISIGVRDNSPPFHTSKVPVIIDVIDINDNPPSIQILWTSSRSEINRDTDPNTIVAHVKLTDYDAISTSFDLEILNRSPFQLIKILPKMWELKLISDLGNFKTNTINLTLKAVDYPQPSLSTTETLTIKIKESLLFENNFLKSRFQVEISSTILNENHHIATAKTTKKLPNKPLFLFKILVYNNLFKINDTTGEILSRRSIDCGKYSFNVSMFSLKTNSIIDETKLEIFIKSGPKLPLYFETGFRKVLIVTGRNQCFPEIAVKNRHCGMRIQYSYNLLLKTDGILRINDHGALCTTDNVRDNKLISSRYLYQIKAHDETNSSAVCVVLFAFQPSKDFRVLPTEINITLPIIDNRNFDFSVPIGKIVATYTKFPPAQFLGFIQYHLVSDELSSGAISVDSQSGEILMKKFPIHKTPIRLIIKSVIKDQASDSSLTLVKINFQKLVFARSLYQFFLTKSETVRNPVRIGQVSIDSLWTESVSYYLSDVGNYYSYFSIDVITGVISGKDLGSLSNKSIVFQVYANSPKSQASYAQVIIYIEDALHQPGFDFSNLLVNIWENTTKGIEIMQVFPKYPSLSDNYQIVRSQYSDWISIHSKTGQIFLNKQFDREEMSYLVVTVQLTNRIGSATVDLHLNILDINDNNPHCQRTKTNVTFEDQSSLGETKCPLKCSDVDSFPNANLTYRMKVVKPVGMNNPFSINPTTGCLVIISSLDLWNSNPSGIINLLIIVSDNGPFNSLATEVEISVRIIDANNHSPTLSSTNVFYLNPTALYGTEVGTLLIKDEDVGEKGEIELSLKQTLFSNCFYIEKLSRNAFLIRVKNLDSIKTQFEPLNVMLTASDRGSPLKSSIIGVVINFIDSNRNPPEIVMPNQHKQMIFFCPLSSGSEIFTVYAVDPDHGLNSKFNYSIEISGDNEDILHIDSWTGLITTKVSLSCAHNIRIRIFVSDLGFPKMTSSVDTLLKPLYEPKSEEFLINKNLTFIIPDHSQPGYLVGDLNIFPESYGHYNRFCKVRGAYGKAGAVNASSVDAGAVDVGAVDVGAVDIGAVDAGAVNAGAVDAGAVNAGAVDVGVVDVGDVDVYAVEVGVVDVGAVSSDTNCSDVEKTTIISAKCLFMSNTTTTADEFLHLRYDSQQLILLKDSGNVKSAHYSLIVVFNKKNLFSISSNLYLNIIVNRVGFSWPLFSKDSPKFLEIKENLPTESHVATFVIRPLRNLEVVYSIKQPDNYFVINPVSGKLVTFRMFDRETEKEIQFYVEVIATHVSNPKIFTVLPVRVSIVDENDNEPFILSPASTIVRISAPMTENASLFQIVAKDLDVGLNSKLNYQINPSSDGIFKINGDSGEIHLVSAPRVSAYELNVTVRDCGEIPKSVSVVFSVHFQSIKTKSKIRFLSNSLSMNLSLPQSKPGFIIGKLAYSQTSSTGNLDIRYYLIAGKFSQIFVIDPITGVVKIQHSVSREEIGNSEIVQIPSVIQSLQDGTIYDLRNISIYIDYGNENAPKFSRSIFKVKLPEDEAITNFLTVVANDPDLGIYGKITYALEGDTFDKKIFIDPLTGKLSCSPLSYAEKNTYNLKIIATDSGGHSTGRKDSTKVIIFVQNTRQHTLAFNATHFSLKVFENSPGGTVLGRINIVKSPVNSEIFYILNPGHSHIMINSTTGELRTNGRLHLDLVEFIELTIHAFAKSISTRSIQTTSAIIDVRIIDINDNQPIPSENPVKIFIPNSNQPQKPLTKLSASDSDKISNITYHFDLNDPITRTLYSKYLLDGRSGNLFLKSNVPSKEKLRHFLKVFVSDNGVPNKYTVVLIDISLNQDHQMVEIAPEKAVFRVKENSPDGTFIGQIKMVDYCKIESTKFSIIDGVNHELVFLHESTGKIFVATPARIDREKTDKIILWTQASCGRLDNRGYKKVIIYVDDVDDNKPVFSQNNFVAFLNEGQPPKTPVIRLTVYDPDIGLNSQVEYFIEFYSSQEEFLIDANGEIKTNIPLNFHTKSMYDLVIKASSKASPFVFAECRLTVYIVNINDQRPKISIPNRNLKLNTNLAVGSFITKITAKDSDGPDGISYRIRHRKLTNQTLFLNVAYDSGEIFLSRKLSVSDIGKHEFDIVVDDARFSSTAVIEIDIEDRNNHPPILEENGKIIILSSSLKRGSVILYLHADDKDSGDNGKVTFELVSTSPWFGLRGFDNNTAALFLIDEPKEKNRPYFLGIQLTDNAIDPQKRLMSVSALTVLLKYPKSHSPHLIGNDSTEITVSESEKSGSKITKFVCKDLYSDRAIFYKIENLHPMSNNFYVDSESGELFLTKSLNYGILPGILLTVTCAIVGSPEKITSFNLSIRVEKENKGPNLVDNKIMTLSLQVPEVIQNPAIISNLLHLDKNSFQCSYYLISVAPEHPENIYNPPNFQIDSSNILWWISGDLFESRIWNLTISVVKAQKYQNGPLNLYENGYLFVNIEVPKQMTGSLSKCVDIKRLTGVINENEPSRTTALKLPNWYHDTQYFLAPHDNFELACSQSPNSGCNIKSKSFLDFETQENYRLQLSVKGSYLYLRSCSHTIMVVITVLDVDEYFPEFVHQSYSHNVEGGIPKLGQILLTVHASDKDRGRFGLVSYQIVENPSENFDINNETGAIFIKNEFTVEKEHKRILKRSVNNDDVPKSYRKTFQFRISASSGLKTSYAYAELTMLIPGIKPSIFQTRLTEMQIILISTVPIGVIIIIIICIVLYLLIRKHLSLKGQLPHKESNCPSSHTESPKTSNSCNTNMSLGSSRTKSKRYNSNHQGLPDIAQMLLGHPNDHLTHSDTQDFNLSYDENKQTISSYGTSEQPSKYGHSSDTSLKLEEKEYNNNGLMYPKMNCDSGIGYNQCSRDFCDDPRMDTKRRSKLEYNQTKYQESNSSLNSSSGYSAITNNVPNTITSNTSIFNNNNNNIINVAPHKTFSNTHSLGSFGDGLGNFSKERNADPHYPRFSTNRSGDWIHLMVNRNNPTLSGAIPLENLAHCSDYRNNNHPSTLSMMPKYSEDINFRLVPNYYPCQNDFHADVERDVSSSNRNTISSNNTVPESYGDVTEI